MKKLLILHNAKDPGGIQSVCRMIATNAELIGISKSIDLRRSTLKLNFFRRIRSMRFIRLVYLSGYILLFRPKIIVCTHINQLRLLNFLKYNCTIVLVCHGGEVWGNSAVRFFASKFKIVFLCVSEFTSLQIKVRHSVNTDRIKRLHLSSELFTKVRSGQDNIKDRSNFNILTVSRLERTDRYKGVDNAILAVAELKPKYTNIKLRIIGTGDDIDYYKQLIAKRNLQENVSLLGYVSFGELIGNYKTSDLFLLPGRPKISNFYSEGEGFGIVFIEAGYFGVPAVGGAGDGASEAILDGISGILVDGTDLYSIISGIEKLILDNDLRIKMSISAQRNSEINHSLEKFRQDLCDAMEEANHL